MLRNLVIVGFLAVLFSCRSNSDKETEALTNDTLATTIVANSDTLSQDTASIANEDVELSDENQLFYIVSIAEESNYGNLRAIAVKASQFLKFRFDTLERYFNPTKHRIVLPDNHPDDIYAGDYYLRRYDDGFVSIEMRNAYKDTLLKGDAEVKFYSDTTKMFVFAAMYGEKKQADSLVNSLKKQFKTTKIITTYIYMGCMH